MILGINTVVFKATLRSRPPKEDGRVYKQAQSEAVGRFTRAQASPLADLSSVSHFTGGVVLFWTLPERPATQPLSLCGRYLSEPSIFHQVGLSSGVEK